MKTFLWGLCLVLTFSGHVWAQDAGSATVKVLAESMSSWDGNVLPEYGKGTPKITILRITVPPKVELPLHQHPVINAGVLLRGELTVMTDEGEVLHLTAGNSIVEVVNKWHYGKNEGDEAAEIIVFYAGTQGEAITVGKKE